LGGIHPYGRVQEWGEAIKVLAIAGSQARAIGSLGIGQGKGIHGQVAHLQTPQEAQLFAHGIVKATADPNVPKYAKAHSVLLAINRKLRKRTQTPILTVNRVFQYLHQNGIPQNTT
jgi:hypothetical protein